ncbi:MULTISPECIES: formate dehydrogenase accessory sulfurtransferase FdhD [Bacillaceae]|uniref:Sulfur carrier protein FdhD n=1 Tax=Evansella alkalicola TaxID=745819 RepID=A0ABS6JN44_9BACI|nr:MULTISPECIES: formate dehydrogenase accessory sulfurtransferase FdhD [Bacillaceae]MBU9719974.1 formate dehydrogenase accessory sulfurtransferase FdhD [Bacillus alkalicola]
MKNNVSRALPIVKYEQDSGFHKMEDAIAIEFPLTIQLDGEEFGTMLCTPSHMEELVIGFLASEGVIRLPSEIDSLSIDEGKGFAYVSLKRKLASDYRSMSKRVIGSCCGKSRQFYFSNDVKTAKTIFSKTKINPAQAFQLMKSLEDTSGHFQETGGLHNGALCTKEEVLVSRADIGRHNVLDKIYGYCLKNGVSLRDKVIVFSGRVSSEVLLKVSKIGVGIILSKSAPTTMGIQLAEDLGITLVGFARGKRFNIYSHPERIGD